MGIQGRSREERRVHPDPLRNLSEEVPSRGCEGWQKVSRLGV